MKWFRHHGNASMMRPCSEIFHIFGYYGLGMFWVMLEKVVGLGDGHYPLKELLRLRSNHFPGSKIIELINTSEILRIDPDGKVRIAPDHARLFGVQHCCTAHDFKPDNNVNACANIVDSLDKDKEEDKLLQQLRAQYPRLMKMRDPLTREQLDRLIALHGEQRVAQTMMELDNYRRINNYISAYRTLLSWCRPRQ